MLQDLRLAVRNLLRQPIFSLVAVLTIALGIGANAAIFSVVDTVILRPMPYPNGERMRFVWLTPTSGSGVMITPSVALARTFARESRAFESLDLYVGEARVTPGPEGAETVNVAQARPSLFALLQGRPAIGRLLVEDDLRPGAPDVAVISREMWQTRYGGDPGVLERDIQLDDRVYRIVGVTERGFRAPSGDPDIWVPLRPNPREPDVTRRATVLGVLAPGTTTAEASAELQRMAAGAGDADLLLARNFQPEAVDPAFFVGETLRRSSFVLFAAVALLLTIGCSNVAALLVTRNAARARELAIRQAIGATRGRLVRLLVGEALVLGSAAGVLGVLLAIGLLGLARAYVPARLVPAEALQVDTAVLVFAALVALATTAAFGMLPAFHGTRVDLTAAMRSDARSGSLSRARHRTRRVLTVAEVALAVILLVGAGLLVRSFVRLRQIPLGFDPRGTISISVELPETRYADDASRRQFYERLLEMARGLPGVIAAARTTDLPPSSGVMFGDGMRIRERADPGPHGPAMVSGSTVSDDYFDLMRIPVLRGRSFGPQDTRGSERVTVINETLARKVWGAEDPIGQHITFSSGPNLVWARVIGIVGNVKAAGLRGGGFGDYQVYDSTRQSEPRHGSVIVRAAGDPAALGPLLRARVAELDPMLPVQSIATGEERIALALAQERFNVLLLGIFGALGLVLAATGIYGMMGLYVAHRRHEIGVRLALGATPRAVAGLVVRQSAVLTAAGLAAGVGGAALLTRFMDKLLYETRATDPATFAAVVLAITVISTAATVLPVRRAVRIEPAAALRAD